jgi:glycosyltransferase involved in cell wall biosynthesis
MNKPKLLFVDHSFHEKTASSRFLINILREDFDVDIFWDDSWRGGRGPSLDLINGYKYVVFLQVLLPLYKLRKVRTNIVWVPMYDGVNLSSWYWKALSHMPLHVLSFSGKIDQRCKMFGISVLSLRYYLSPSPQKEKATYSGLNIFFWYRGSVTFPDVKALIDPRDVHRFIYRSGSDQFFREEEISVEDIRKYKLEKVPRFSADPDEYFRLLEDADVFVAPRKKEGIGMSFLEAMAKGKVIIAYDDATMNEYIKDGYNGYLFSEPSKSIHFDHFAEIRKNLWESAVHGWKQWEQDKIKISQFVFDAVLSDNKSVLPLWCWIYIFYDSCERRLRGVIFKESWLTKAALNFKKIIHA